MSEVPYSPLEDEGTSRTQRLISSCVGQRRNAGKASTAGNLCLTRIVRAAGLRPAKGVEVIEARPSRRHGLRYEPMRCLRGATWNTRLQVRGPHRESKPCRGLAARRQQSGRSTRYAKKPFGQLGQPRLRGKYLEDIDPSRWY